MNQNAESASSTELAPLTMEQRAQKALGLVNAKEKLTELAAASAGITEITNKAGYDECHAKRMVLKNKRVEISKTGKAAREDATAFSKAVIAAEQSLIDIISPEEDRLQKLQQAWDDAREAERAEAARVEAERVQKQKDALAIITGSLSRLFGADVETLSVALDQLTNFDMDQFDIVFRPDAEKARDEAIAAIAKARDERVQLDIQAAELRRQQEETERKAALEAEARRAEQAKEDAERAERIAEEDRQRAARLADEDRQRAAQAEADRVTRAAAQKVLDDQQAELDRQAAEQRQRDEAAAQTLREAQEHADQERRDREAAEKAEAAQREAEAAEAAIQTATAREAMQEAVDTLAEIEAMNPFAPADADRLLPAINLTIRKLAAVLAKETA